MAAPSRPQAPGWQQPAGTQDWQTDGVGGGAIAPSWGSVATGLKLMKIAAIVKIVATVGVLLLFIIAIVVGGAAIMSAIPSAGGRGGSSNNAAAGIGIAALLLVGGGVLLFYLTLFIQYVLQIVGGVMCISVPPDSGAKGMGIGVLVCLLLPILFFMVQMADAVIQSGIIGPLSQLAQLGVMLVEWVLFILFMRQVAIALQSEELRKRVMSFAIWCGIYIGYALLGICGGIGLAIAFGVFAASSAGSGGPGGGGGGSSGQGLAAMGIAFIVAIGIFVLGLLVISLVNLVKYFGMLNSAIAVIRRRLAAA
jgi:hypothetical protein